MVLCCIDHISHSVVSSFLVVARFVDLKVVDLLLFTVKFPVVDGTDARGGAQVVAVGAPVFTHRSHSSKGDVSWSKHSAIVTDQMMVLESFRHMVCNHRIRFTPLVYSALVVRIMLYHIATAILRIDTGTFRNFRRPVAKRE